MTDAQFSTLIAAIVGGLGSLAAVIKWSVGRLTEALDGNTKAHLESVKAMTEMSTKLDFVYRATGKVEDFIKEEISATYEAEDVTPRLKPRKSPGLYFQRPKTEPGEKK